MANDGKGEPHLVVLPFMATGHINPLLQISKKLASRGFTVSFATTRQYMPTVGKSFGEASSGEVRLIELKVPDSNLYTDEKARFDPCKELPPGLALSETLEEPFESLVKSLKTPPPICIISDFLLGWTQNVANRLGIPRVNVQCVGAYPANLTELVWDILPRKMHRTRSGEYVVPLDRLNLAPLNLSQISPHLVEVDESHPERLFLLRQFASNRQSWTTIINSFYELESAHVEEFQKRYSGAVRTVGPLLPSAAMFSASYRGALEGAATLPEVAWLDAQSPGSVVYVSFGTVHRFPRAQIGELALGLEGSGKPFLWVLRVPPDAEESSASPLDFLPTEFLKRTKERGLVLTAFVDQLAVLSHPSVGAFVSHCGWNSVMEGIVNGVPLIAWPLSAEQPFNAKFVVEEAKIGVQVVRGRDGIVSRDDIQRLVTCVFEEEVGMGLRKRCQELKECCRRSVAEDGGSSALNFNLFVNDLFSLHPRKLS